MFSNSTIKSALGSFKNDSKSDKIGKAIDQISNHKKQMPSIISKDSKIEGEFFSSGIIEIEGKVKGQITSNTVIIREDGYVNGEINAQSVSIKGQFNGNIKAKNINIFGKAKVNGTIEYQTLSVEDGASIDGQFKQLQEKNK